MKHKDFTNDLIKVKWDGFIYNNLEPLIQSKTRGTTL